MNSPVKNICFGGRAGAFQHPVSNFKRQASAFTLIEMMVVVAIIAILATFLFPAALRSRDRARRMQAMSEACNLAIAIKMYRVEHGKWPNQTQDGSDTTYFTDNWKVVNLLRIPASNDMNRIYISVQANALDGSGNYLDPWGVPYVICMDEDGNGKLSMRIESTAYHNEKTGEDMEFEAKSEERDSLAGVMAASIGGDSMIASWEGID